MIVKNVFMDVEFDKNIDKMTENAVVNTSAAKEHGTEIERTIRTVKKRTSCIVNTMTFKYLHKLLVTSIVYFSVLWMNVLPVKNEILDKFSPREIIVRTNLYWKNTTSC